MPPAIKKYVVTEGECVVLALIARDAPTTAYKLRKGLERSPEFGLSSSAGAIYPIIRRLKEKSYVTAAAIEADGRNPELLRVTNGGRKIIRHWIRQAGTEQLLTIDPLRTRMAHLWLLRAGERIAWLRRIREALARQLGRPDGSHQDEGARNDHWSSHVRHMTRARIEWLDEIIARESAAF